MITNANVLITGGLGFIGSNLAKHLVNANCTVTLLDSMIPKYGGNLQNIAAFKDRVRVNFSDMRDKFSLMHLVKGQDFIFNLAGQTSHLDSMHDPFTDLDINATSQLSLLEVVKEVNPAVKVIFASTRQIYGKPNYLPVNEDHPIVPVDVNGINKWSGEQYHILYHKVYGIRTSVLRLTNTYGPCMRVKDARQTFLGIWLKNAILNEPVQVFGDGKQLRDFNYVDDVVSALVAAAANKSADGQIMNLGSKEVISLWDLALLIQRIKPGTQVNLVPFPPERKAIDIGDYYSNYDLAQKIIQWQPQVSLLEGLKRSIEYYQTNQKEYF